MARTIKTIVQSALNDSESEIMDLMKLHGITNKVKFKKVKSKLQNILEKVLRKISKNTGEKNNFKPR